VTQAHFELFLSSSTDDQMSLAVPLLPNPANWAGEVAEMKTAFAHHGKRPRLEYIAELHPTLGRNLEEAGLVRQSRVPVMILDMVDLAPPGDLPPSVRYQRLVAADDPLLRAFLMNQSIAFGGAGGEEALGWLSTMRYGLTAGSVLAATLIHEETPVSGAVVQIGDYIGELAGVWTSPDWRNRGLAYGVCRQLLAEYAATGYKLSWLSAAEGAQRLYEKLGFVIAGTQMNYAEIREVVE
jgi:ribosomal protein S18 acetylase RimI-like enzyme